MDDRTLRDAAIQAEYESGRHEETEAKAKAHAAVRVARMSIGTIVTLGGLAMMPLPGPGLPIVDDGGITRSAILTMILSGAAGILFSLWWFFVR